MAEFQMPSLGADMTEGTLLEWLVQPGDTVHRGDIVAVVDTSKSAIDVEVFEDGLIEELLVEPGSTVAVGTPLARLGTATEPVPEPRAPASPPTPEALTAELDASPPVADSEVEKQPQVVMHQGQAAEHRVTASHRVAASPLARRRAATLGIDLAAVVGSGPSGAVSIADIEAAAAEAAGDEASPTTVVLPDASSDVAAPSAEIPPRVTTHRGGGGAGARGDGREARSADQGRAMREAIGALMARSKKEIPHYYLQTTIDMHRALAWLERVNAARAVAGRILPAALMLKAAARAARDVRDMNGFFVDGAFQHAEHVHLGVAVSLRGGGLIAPALHDADTLTIDELMAALKDLATRARSGRLRSSEMSDPTLTVTNLGEQGVEAVHGVIYPPQVALVGFGRVVERPWAIDGMLTVRPLMIATLAADHRVSDGHLGGLFLTAIDEALQEPEEL